MKTEDNYIDQHFYFKGKWEVPSLCGLKIVEKEEQTIVIATNLYELNPGTSISRWIEPLATDIVRNFKIDPKKLVFIERNPDKNSKLEFYEETFDRVDFEWDGDQLSNAQWKRISKGEIERLIS